MTGQTCMKSVMTGQKKAADCSAAMKSAMDTQCGVKIGDTESNKLKEAAARTALTMCKMKGDADCDAKFRNATGKAGNVTAADKAKDKFEAARGARTAIADLM